MPCSVWDLSFLTRESNSTLGTECPNHWATREGPNFYIRNKKSKIQRVKLKSVRVSKIIQSGPVLSFKSS